MSRLDYVQLVDVLKDIKEGDKLEVKDDGECLLKVHNGELCWCSLDGKEVGATVIMSLDNLQALVRLVPQYVGWREAFEAYEKGSRIECEWNGRMVWFKRDIASFEEISFLTDKLLDGLLETKWIIK